MRAFTLFCLLLALVNANAQVIHVPGDYPTIQQGINAAAPGDTVLVADGVYYEQVNFMGKKPLLVTSNFIFDSDSTHLYNTIIDGSLLPQGQASVVIFSEGSDTTAVISGFTIQNGSGTMDDYSFIGGGIFIRSSGAKIINNRIIQNKLTTDYSYGAGVGTNSCNNSNWIVIRDNLISDNFNNGVGGAMSVRSNIKCESNIVSNNKAMEAAGIIYSGTNRIAVFRSNNIINNKCSLELEYLETYGGGFAAWDTDSIVFLNNRVIGNIIETYSHAWGAGALIWGRKAIISGNNFEGNIAHTFSNYSSVIYGGGLSIVCQQVTIEDNIFKANQTKGIGNHEGGGIWANCNNLLIRNNVFYLNETRTYLGTTFGGALYLNDLNNVCLINNTFSDNTAEYGGAIFMGASITKFLNNIFWQDNAAYGAEIYGNGSIAYCNIDTTKLYGSFEILEGNILENPLFCENNCLQPETGSPCLNRGTGIFIFPDGDTLTAPANDILGQLRPAGAGYDMGAYELLIESIPEGKNLLDFAVYPNPFTDNLWCHYRLDEKSDVTITVYDILGRVQLSWHKVLKAGEYDTPLELGTLVNGIYLIKTDFNGREISGKVIKQDR